jgi:hypothetical protein
MNFKPLDAQVAAIVAQYDFISDVFPLFTSVKALIYPSVESKGL